MKILFLLLWFVLSSAHSMNITARSWIETDIHGNLIQGYNASEVRSIASITKLMTAMVVIDSNQDMNQKIGRYSREDLIQLVLVKSDNRAATALCKAFPGGYKECIRLMNAKAASLAMYNTVFVDSTGISSLNRSTAIELLQLVIEASKYPAIVKASQTPVLYLKPGKQTLSFRNTNPLVGQRQDIIVSKTGTTTAAGGCIVMMVDTVYGKRIIVVLGSKAGKRIPEAEFIAVNTRSN